MAEFTDLELGCLRRIVSDWVDEGFTTPPYDPIVYDIFDKISLTPWEFAQYDIKRPVTPSEQADS